MVDTAPSVIAKAEMGLGLEDYRPVLECVLDRLRRRLGDHLLAMALFGSAARGEAGPHSDLDLLIVHQGKRQEIHRAFVDIVLELRETSEYKRLEQHGILADPYAIFISREKLADTPWILLDVMDHGIILYDPHGVLEEKLEALRARLDELDAQKVVLEDGTWYWDLKPDWKPGEVFEL